MPSDGPPRPAGAGDVEVAEAQWPGSLMDSSVALNGSAVRARPPGGVPRHVPGLRATRSSLGLHSSVCHPEKGIHSSVLNAEKRIQSSW
jgi:hypothetical protein